MSTAMDRQFLSFLPPRLQHYRRPGPWLCASLLFALIGAIALLPWAPPVVAKHALMADAKAALLVLIASGLWFRAQQSRQPELKLFRTGLALAISCWTLGWVIFSIELWYGREIGIDLVEEVLHGLCYLVLVWALDRLENRPPRGFAPLFVLAMFGYLLLLPALGARREYDNWAPSFLFFLFLDAYVALRCYLLAMRNSSPQLNRTLRLTTWAFAGALVVNGIDWAMFAGLYRPDGSDWWSLISLLFLIPFIRLASPGRWRQRRPVLLCPTWASWWLRPAAAFLLLALLPLALHLLGYGSGLLLPETRSVRDFYLLVWLLLVGVLMARHWRPQWWLPPQSDSFQQNAELHALAASSHFRPGANHAALSVPDIAPLATTKALCRDPLLTRLDQVLAERHAQNGLDLDQLADAMAMSPRQLQRRLKAAADISPADYLRRYRLEQGARLLAQDNKVAWVAQAVGFAHHSHFGRCFKQQYGLTPGEYQQRCREQLLGDAVSAGVAGVTG